MMFPGESMYGWGVFDVAIPRSAQDIYTDRRKRKAKIAFPDRRHAAARLWRSFGIPRIFVDDFPWNQALVASFLSAILFAWISLIADDLPRNYEGQTSRHVDISISMFEPAAQKEASSSEEKPLQASDYVHVEQEKVTGPAAEKPQQINVTRLEEIKQPLYRNVQESASEEPIPDIRRKTTISLTPAEPRKTKAPGVFRLEEEPEGEEIATLPQALRQRKYGKDDSDTTLPETQPDALTDLLTTEIDEPEVIAPHTGRLKRIYKSAMVDPDNSGSSQRIVSTDLFPSSGSAESVETLSPDQGQVDQRYAFKRKGSIHVTQTIPPKAKPQAVLQLRKRKEQPESELPTKPRSFSRSSSGHKAAVTTSLTPSLPSLRQQVSDSSVSLPERPESDVRYVFKEKVRSQAQGKQTLDLQFNFEPKRRKENLIAAPRVRAKSLSNGPRPSQNRSELLAKAPDFSGNVLPDDIDPSQLTSLKEFDVCENPEEEFHLKTQIAVRLDGPSLFESGGVLFFCKYTESGYTVQVDIYNPQGRPFKDRCEVLLQAIIGVVNATN